MERNIDIPDMNSRPNATGYIITPGFRVGLLFQRAEMQLYGWPYIKEHYKIVRRGERRLREIQEELTRAGTPESEEALNLQREYDSQLDDIMHTEDCIRNWRLRFNTWAVAYRFPKDERHPNRIYPSIRSGELEEVIDRAAAVFARNAVISTLEKPIFSHDFRLSEFERTYHPDGHQLPRSSRYRDIPVPEGVLYYFKKELRKRRQKLIGEIN